MCAKQQQDDEKERVRVARLARLAGTGTLHSGGEPREEPHAHENRQQQTWEGERDKQRKAAFFRTMEDRVLDYKRVHPSVIHAWVLELLRLCESEAMARGRACVRARDGLQHIRGGEELLLHAGFRPAVVSMERCYLYVRNEDSGGDSVLAEACRLLRKAEATVREKAERAQQDKEERKRAEQEHRFRVIAAFEQDKAERAARVSVTSLNLEQDRQNNKR